MLIHRYCCCHCCCYYYCYPFLISTASFFMALNKIAHSQNFKLVCLEWMYFFFLKFKTIISCFRNRNFDFYLNKTHFFSFQKNFTQSILFWFHSASVRQLVNKGLSSCSWMWSKILGDCHNFFFFDEFAFLLFGLHLHSVTSVMQSITTNYCTIQMNHISILPTCREKNTVFINLTSQKFGS